MIQNLTAKDWDELTFKQQKMFETRIDEYGGFGSGESCRNILPYLPSIGQIWGALEKEIECIFLRNEKGTWVVELKDRASLPKQFENKEPLYALWGAYKFYTNEYD